MKQESINTLVDRMRYGRVFLFLGFDYFLDSFPFNPVLKVISEDLNLSRDIESFEDLYSVSNSLDTESHFHNVKKHVDKIPTNNSLDIISKVKWNAIYTSSIDDLILNRLKGFGRDTFPICKSNKSFSYGRDDLNIFHLFGLYSRTDDSEKVPDNRVKLSRRRLEASLMFTNLVESMGPLDTLLVAGWTPESDPFTSEMFYQVTSRLSEGQVYLFGNKVEIEDDFIKDLCESNILSITGVRLTEFIESQKSLISSMESKNSDIDSFIRVNDKALEIPPRIKRIVNHYGHIVEDRDFNSVVQDKNELFKDFLFESSRLPIWQAYPEDIDFERDYFKTLYETLIKEVTKNKVSQEPVILHGSTGTGKSIALARLCYKLYSESKYLVLHINNHRDSLDFKVIDDVCEWAESSADLTTIICWDGMSNVDAYENLSSYLASRGRKQIVVGTTYRLKNSNSKRFVAADECFNENENFRFKKYLSYHGIDIGNVINSFDSMFLVTLYRLLPETRFAITSGVINEANHIKEYIKHNTKISESCESIIADAFKNAFKKANLVTNVSKTIIQDINIDNIIDIVMVFGKFGIETPLDIILRIFPKLKASNIGLIFKKIDIIRWSENSYGEILLSARNTLEAEIYCKRILSNYKEHVHRLLMVIEHVEQKRAINCSEIRFCVEIVRAFSPNGNSGKEYQDYYLDISNALGLLMASKKIESPKLMLLQANLVREYGKRKYNDRDVYYPEYLTLLLEALKVIEQAISIEENHTHNRRQTNYSLVSLYGEKASILGTISNQYENQGNNEKQVSKYIIEAIDTIKQSFKYDVYNYISLDSIAWIAINYVKRSHELHGERLQILMEAISKFDEYNASDIEERHQSDFLVRKSKLHEALGDTAITDSTLEELKTISIEDYHYYMISKLISEVDFHNDLKKRDENAVKDALHYIEENNNDIESSYKINVLKLRLYWLLETTEPMLNSERMAVCKGENFWSVIVELTSKVISCSYNNNVTIYKFLKGVALFHLSQYKSCEDIFRNLSRESESINGSRRVFKSFVMSNELGVKKLSGELTQINAPRNRGQIYIDELKTTVRLLPSDFSLTESDRGSSLNNFHIAFNFLGPLADNEKYYKGIK
ncbi:hypothetical protein BBL88_17745 [Vibrio parahaemolyticus]|uniref:P-loop NTPase n=1 Tax=Vibrio parahaemolyticus TaxID=670 RepID=UPI00084B0FD3|nr:hypothetical protein [Vibrio parahaemolyticus]ODW50568.1 hypothetical protein BBL88_17745 [Vibrio parahaemolyticus]